MVLICFKTGLIIRWMIMNCFLKLFLITWIILFPSLGDSDAEEEDEEDTDMKKYDEGEVTVDKEDEIAVEMFMRPRRETRTRWALTSSL